MRKLLFVTIISVFGTSVFCQVLPNFMTEQEMKNLPFYTKPQSKGITYPHSAPLRTAAEWEEMDAVLISWKGYSSFLTEIIRYAREEVKVYIYANDSNSVKTTLTNAGVNLSNIYFLQTATNSVWIRDYGANNVYTKDVDSLLLVDWVYNRNRPSDDVSPAFFASKVGLPLYEATQAPTDLVNTGGNFMTDGFGNAMASKLVLNENASVTQFNSTPKTEADIDTIVKHFMGINRYIKFNTLPYDGIHHIDMHMKLLDEETILIGQYPNGIADGPQIESNIQYLLNNFNSVFGTPYNVIRIPMPPNQSSPTWPSTGGNYLTYANSLIINKTVLVPTYYQQYDTTALRIYRQAMPGYRIVGINSNSIISASGSIHCTTHEIGTRNPLLISHQRLHDADPSLVSYNVSALILHRSGIQNAQVYYKIGFNSSYTSTSMTYSGNNDIWNGNIPGQNPGDSIYYYIAATSVSGKTQVRPITAPQGYWAFKILDATSYKAMADNDFNLSYLGSNIVSDNLKFEVKSDEETSVQISVYNVMGNKIGTIYHGNIYSGASEFTVNTSSLKSGIYFIKAYSKFGNRNLRFIVK